MSQTANPDHARHDRTLIAAHAAGDSPAIDTAATALLATCRDCAQLYRDLLAIASATRALPAAAIAPRDFRLTADQAARLRGGSWLRALLRPFASSGSGIQALAAVLTSAGVAGLLVAAFVPGLLGGGAAPATMQPPTAGRAQGPSAAAAPEFGVESSPALAAAGAGEPTDARGIAKAAASSELQRDAALSQASPASAAGGAGGGDAAQPPAVMGSEARPSLLVPGSVGVLLLGLALFVLRVAARRVR